MNLEADCTWIPYECLRASQSFVHRPRVNTFIQSYLNGEWVDPPTAYEHPRNANYVVQDGHNRTFAIYELYRQGYTILGMGGQEMSIEGGMPVALFALPFYRLPHLFLYEIGKLTEKTEERQPKGKQSGFGSRA